MTTRRPDEPHDLDQADMIIPTTIADAITALDGVNALLMAKHWERAAIVWAFTYEGVNQHASRELVRQPIIKFAGLGIAGLTTQDTVRRYRNAWKDAGLPDVRPGDAVTLPTLPFPSSDTVRLDVADREAIEAQAEADGAGTTKALDIAQNLTAMAAVIKGSPAVAKAASAALAENAAARFEAAEAAMSPRVYGPEEALMDAAGEAIREQLGMLETSRPCKTVLIGWDSSSGEFGVAPRVAAGPVMCVVVGNAQDGDVRWVVVGRVLVDVVQVQPLAPPLAHATHAPVARLKITSKRVGYAGLRHRLRIGTRSADGTRVIGKARIVADRDDPVLLLEGLDDAEIIEPRD